MGNSIRSLSGNTRLIASQSTWIEGTAIQQLEKTATLPGMKYVAGMPDLHPGRGYPIGAAFFSQKMIYPALTGGDIGCGMSLWQTTFNIKKFNSHKVAKRLRTVEEALDESWSEEIKEQKQHLNLVDTPFDTSLGTIGGGNHFAEFQQLEEIYDDSLIEQLNLHRQQVVLLVHSGSRGFGQSIMSDHIRAYGHQGLEQGSDAFDHYLQQHNLATRWAGLNRLLIARRFMAAVRTDGQCVLDLHHNFIEPVDYQGESGWIHRKGATPSDRGVVVIPGSRGDYSWLVQPTSADVGLYSLAHGAGRKWKRGNCKDRLSHKFSTEDLQKTALGSLVICQDRTLLYDEAPQAYKPCESIIQDLLDAGLIRLVARLKPMLTFKTQGRCSA